MICLEGRKPEKKVEEIKKSYDESIKASGLKSYREGLSDGVIELIEGFARLRANSMANAHNNIVR